MFLFAFETSTSSARAPTMQCVKNCNGDLAMCNTKKSKSLRGRKMKDFDGWKYLGRSRRKRRGRVRGERGRVGKKILMAGSI